MQTEKRDQLASATALILPAALQDIEVALTYITSGKAGDGVVQIQDALARLKVLIPLFDDACNEAQG